MSRKSRGNSQLLPLSMIVVAALTLVGTGKAVAEDLDYVPVYIRDVPVPDPGTAGPDVYIASPGLPTSPPPNPQVGDSWVWWLWVHYPMPPHFEQHVCTVRGKTDRGYVVVRDQEWNVSIDQADVDAILDYWENTSIGLWPTQGIYELDSLAFGEPPDELDNDPRIYLMWFDFQISADGFFFWFDEYPDGTYPQYHSNECEVLYMNTTSSGGPSGEYMLAVIAHEFEHMIHWKYDDNEDPWVDEGMAELGMWFFGNPDNISAFNSNPDNNLTVWEGTWADYIKTYLWSLYFYERYGGQPSVYAVVHEPLNSIAGYEKVLSDLGYTETFGDVFADWAVANFLDDPSIGDGRFGYVGDDLPAFSTAGNFSTYPVGSTTRTVNHWATDYYRFTGMDGFESLTLTFDGSDDNQFAVWGIGLYDSSGTDVQRMTLDSGQAGAVQINNLTQPGDEVILAVSSISSTGGSSYTFTAYNSTGIESEEPAPAGIELTAWPNPFAGSVTLSMPSMNGAQATIQVFGLDGRLVRTLTPSVSGDGSLAVGWDGCMEDGTPASSGIYFARARAAGMSSTASLMLLR
jgi:hypothetical protein